MLDIAPLRFDDIPAALQLSTHAAWNQLPADWQRLLTLFPQSCLGGRANRQVVATATLAVYSAVGSSRPAVGWVGMVLVDQKHRGRGFGGAMMTAVLDLAAELRVPIVGLDATDLGRPVYLKKGFADEAGLDRWVGPARSAAVASAVPTVGLSDLTASDWPDLAKLDAAATGVDRSALLRRLAGEAGATVRVLRDGAALRGFAFRRIGRVAEYIGPVVAETADNARALVQSLLADASLPAQEKTLIDVPRDTPLADLLRTAGFTVSRHLTRMTRPKTAAPTLSSSRAFAAAAFELG